MAIRPQSSPRGVIGKKALVVGGKEITANSTGIIVDAVTIGAQAVTANSTSIIVPALRIGALASYITVNSTGIRIGTRYISTNTTGNATT
jgi:hypothetical protein